MDTHAYPIYRTTRRGGLDTLAGEVDAEGADEALLTWAAQVGVECATIYAKGCRIVLDPDPSAAPIYYTYAARDRVDPNAEGAF